MTERDKHLLQFDATEIAEAARTEAVYHRERLAYWRTGVKNRIGRPLP